MAGARVALCWLLHVWPGDLASWLRAASITLSRAAIVAHESSAMTLYGHVFQGRYKAILVNKP